MSNSLLTTKLFIPSARPDIVPRPRLVKQLNDGLHRPLTLLSAPAGFGKTTLITEWVSSLNKHTETQIAWLSLDEADNDLNRFLTYFSTAMIQLEGIDTNLWETTREMLQNPNPAPIETILTPLISDISCTSKKIIFVLDDYHLIESQPIHKSLNFWLENVPPQIHTVVITREDPPFPLHRLRARGQMTELRVADLRFTASESTQFLNNIMGLRLEAESVALLEERTEGWIAGLQMAALSMRDRTDVTGFIKNFSGTNRYILDYLLEEVLANQPPDIQQFLLQTSILKNLTAPLCDALLQADNLSASILSHLEQTNLFLLPLDDERHWYRYHHLFVDLLHARLAQTYTREEINALHTRAARWYENNGMIYATIYHASMIPDNEWIENLIEKNYIEIFQRRDSAYIRHWTGELSDESIYTSPRLSIHEAMSRSWLGQLDDADRMLNEAEKRLQEKEPTIETQALYGHLSYVKSRITGMRGDFPKAIALCLTARENTPASNEGLLGGIGVMLGYGYFLNGDFANAVQTLEETILSGKVSGAINTTIGAFCVLARLVALQGQLHRSYELYQEAEKFIDSTKEQNRGAMSIVDVGYAEILYEWNKLDDALTHIRRGLESIPMWSKADDIAMAHNIYSQIHQAQGDLLAAQKAIEKGTQTIQMSGVFSEARDAVTAADIRLRLKQANSQSASYMISSLEKRMKSEYPFRFENELAHITLARVYTAQKKWDECLELLSQLETHAKLDGRGGRLIQILLLQALVMHQKGEQAQAFALLEQALTRAEPEGYARIIIDEGQPMQMLLTQWLSSAGDSPSKAYARHLAAQFGTGSSSAAAEGQLIEPLSPRELEVLNLIALGKTNKEISVELVVSPGTVKAHTSSIYRKLDVVNRTEAVARAREIGILS